jgi:hypothetical protein
MDLPFDGAISAFYETGAPGAIRKAIARADKDDILDPGFPYSERMQRKPYEKAFDKLQIELVKLQHWVRESGARGQGRHDHAAHAEPQPARRARRGASQAFGSRGNAVVFPALYRPSARRGGNRAL